MSWKEIAMYLGVGVLVIGAGAAQIIDKAQAGAAFTALVTFVIGRRIPYGDKKED